MSARERGEATAWRLITLLSEHHPADPERPWVATQAKLDAVRSLVHMLAMESTRDLLAGEWDAAVEAAAAAQMLARTAEEVSAQLSTQLRPAP